MKKTLRKGKFKKVAGVCSGLADYSGLDVTIVRLLMMGLILFWGSGLLVYIILALVMPTYDSDLED